MRTSWRQQLAREQRVKTHMGNGYRQTGTTMRGEKRGEKVCVDKVMCVRVETKLLLQWKLGNEDGDRDCGVQRQLVLVLEQGHGLAKRHVTSEGEDRESEHSRITSLILFILLNFDQDKQYCGDKDRVSALTTTIACS